MHRPLESVANSVLDREFSPPPDQSPSLLGRYVHCQRHERSRHAVIEASGWPAASHIPPGPLSGNVAADFYVGNAVRVNHRLLWPMTARR